MNTMQTSHIKRYNAFCALLMAILIALQFVPFWELNGQHTSISGYIWFPTEHAELTSHFTEVISPDFKVDSIVVSSLLQLVVPAVGIILFFYNRESIFVPVCAAVSGVGGTWSYLTKPVFRLGSYWQVHFIFGILMLTVAAISSIRRWKPRKNE